MTKYNLEEIFEKEEGIEYITEDNKYRVKVLRGELVHTDTTPCAFIKYYTKIKFIEVEKPVSFMEVVNSKEDCRVEHPILDIVVATEEEDNSWWNEFNNKEYLPLNCLLHILGGHLGVKEVKKVISEGKWYIEK